VSDGSDGIAKPSRGLVGAHEALLIGDVEFSLGFSAELIWRAPNERDFEN
jgi:hypothetical protein